MKPLTNLFLMHSNFNNQYLNQPKLALDELLSDFHHHEAKELLWEWYKVTVTDSYSSGMDDQHKRTLSLFYERIALLLDYVYMNRDVNAEQ